MKSNFPKQNRVKHQVRKNLIDALNNGKQYGKGLSCFHMPKSDLHSLHHSNRYKKIVLKKTLKVA